MDEFLEALEALRHELVEEVVDELYRDPFWQARYGDRGRRYAVEDGHHHLDYLEAALRADDPVVLTRYVGWLRTVLTSRGMCSRHIDDNLRRYERRLADLEVGLEVGPAERAREQAVAYLRQARASLRYGDEAPAAAAAQDLEVPHGLVGDGATEGLSWLPSYLADAVAAERPDLFAGHVAWLAGAPAPAGYSPEVVEAALAALQAAAPVGPAGEHDAIVDALDAGRQALDAPEEGEP